MVETTGEGVRIRGMVDTVPTKYLFVACILATIYLIVMLFVGGFGPDSHTEWRSYSFLCNGSFDYRYREGCIGNDMAEEGAEQEIQIPPKDDEGLSRTNFQFALIAWPYNAKYKEMSGTLKTTLNVRTTLYGAQNKDLFDLQPIFERESEETLLCPRNRPDCYGFFLFIERNIDYPYYKVLVEFLDSPGKKYVENVQWESSTQSLGFNDLQLGFRYTYFSIAVVLIIIWLIPLRNLSLSQWPFEQRAVFLLLIGLLLFNNPLFALHLTANSWFWTFLDQSFQILFVCLLLFFWFAFLARMRAAYTGAPPTRVWIFYLKVAVVAMYGLTTMVVAYWLDVKFNRNSELEGFGGIIAFYYFSCAFCGVCLVWVIVGAIVHVPPASEARPHQQIAYMYLVFPSSIVTLSMLVGVFAGMVGPYNQTSLSFLYYFGLFNVYVYLLVFGFFPSVSDLGRGYEVDPERMKLEGQHLMNNDVNDEISNESAVRALGSL